MSAHSEEDGDRLEPLSLFFMGVASLPDPDCQRGLTTTVPLTATTYAPSHQGLCSKQRVSWEQTRQLQKAMSEHIAVMTRHHLPALDREINISVETPATPWETAIGNDAMVVELAADAVEDSVRVSVNTAPMSDLPPPSEDGDESDGPSVSPSDDLYVHLAPDPTSRLWMSQGGPGFCNATITIPASFSGDVVLMPPPTCIPQRLYLPPPAYAEDSGFEPTGDDLRGLAVARWRNADRPEPADRAEPRLGGLGLADTLRQNIQHWVACTGAHRYYSVVVAQDCHRARRGLLGIIRQVVLCANPIPPPYCVLNIDASGLDVTIFRSAEAMMNLCAVTTTSIPAGVVYRHFPMPETGAGDDGNPRVASEFTDLTDARYVVFAAFDHIRTQLGQ